MCSVRSQIIEMDFYLFSVYNPTKIEEKEVVWNALRNKIKSTNNDRFIIGRDFNKIVDLRKKKSGGLTKINKVILDFKKFIEEIGALVYITNTRNLLD